MVGLITRLSSSLPRGNNTEVLFLVVCIIIILRVNLLWGRGTQLQLEPLPVKMVSVRLLHLIHGPGKITIEMAFQVVFKNYPSTEVFRSIMYVD